MRYFSGSTSCDSMSRVGFLPVDRFADNIRPCQYTAVEELGSFALINLYEDPDLKEYIADTDRRTLRKLSDQWRALRDIDLDTHWPLFKSVHEQAFPASGWKPLFLVRSWIQNNLKAFDDFSPDIVCTGGHLKCLMDMPNMFINDIPQNTQTERLSYAACKRNGIIYLARSKFWDSAKATREMYRKNRFQQLVTRTSDGTKENPALGMDTFEYPYSVFGRAIGRTRILYTQKTDCVDPNTDSSSGSYITLSIVDNTMVPSVRRSKIKDDRRFCSWTEQNQARATWTRCFLSGSTEALLGVRRNDKLTHCERIRTEKIPDKAMCPKDPRACWVHWSKERNLSFLNDFLEFVRTTVTVDYDSSAYGFLINYSHRKMSIEAVEWTKGTDEFKNHNILIQWGGEEAWPIPKQHDFNETLQRTYARWKEMKLL